ncbi:MAG: ABC transporter ATP-binding protein [Bacteroidetes bacterium]|nr:ABC transporter ATP-binding protein [Bacteroidota bacterium]MDA1336622.1 ABC transporter ATP-binding protein [Bacteroidota bacterium]
MIELNSIWKSYQTGSQSMDVLKGIDCKIDAGELVAIMGSSGSGKSTLLNVLGLLDDFDQGSYHLDGMNMKGLSEKQAAKYRSEFLGFVFQSFNLIHYKTAMENVALPLYYQGVNRRKRQELALQFLKKVGLEAWYNHLPNQMSGGQKQRVAIARALISNPRVILADEPTGALDSKTSNEVMELLKSINKEGITIVVVTHENEIAAQCHRIIRLRDGQIENE